MTLSARRLAWDLLREWETGAYPTISEALKHRSGGDARDRGLARELALGVVRHLRLYDALADRFLRSGSQAPVLRRALRLCAHQLFALDRIPTHAAVATTVDLLRAVGEDRFLGVANAVCRRLAELRQAERDPAQPDPALGRIAAGDLPVDPGERFSLPSRLLTELGPVPAADLAWLNHVPSLCTRWRPGRRLTVAPELLLREEGDACWWREPEAALRGPVAAGAAVVQDRAQTRALELAAPQAGERVLDLCAAPGGKTRWLFDQGCVVTAADVNPAKVVKLRADMPPEVTVLAQDGRHPDLPPDFDLVVVDAPCSNSGVLARRPEARWRYDEAHLSELHALQRDLLRAAAGLVRPGGRLLYSTCSLAPAENQAVASDLSGWQVVAEHRIWPDAWMAGGFAAVLRRR